MTVAAAARRYVEVKAERADDFGFELTVSELVDEAGMSYADALGLLLQLQALEQCRVLRRFYATDEAGRPVPVGKPRFYRDGSPGLGIVPEHLRPYTPELLVVVEAHFP